MKKIILYAAIPLLVGTSFCVLNGYVLKNKPVTHKISKDKQEEIFTENIYKKFDILLKYPKDYKIEENLFLGDDGWKSATIFSIFKKDLVSEKGEFVVLPMHLVAEKQPRVMGGKIFTDVKSIGLKGDIFINKNGVISVKSFIKKDGGAQNDDMYQYVMIHKQLIYNFFIKGDEVSMLSAIDNLSVFN